MTAKKTSSGKKVAGKKSAPRKKTAKSKQTSSAGSSKKTAKKTAGRSASSAKTKSTKSTLKAADRKKLREILLSMREQLTGQINALKGESLTRDDAVNSEEDGTDAFERQFALDIARTENESVYEIDDALRRLDEGTYGVCEECGETINTARLSALPFTRMCIACKSEQENGKNGTRRRPSPRL